MKISMMGTRGIPARYGGFETCVEELSVRLAARGHEVTVYCHGNMNREGDRLFKNVNLVYIPRLNSRSANFLFNGVASTLRGILVDSSDILHYFGCGRVPFATLSRLGGRRVVMTLDGLEWKRESYPKSVRSIIRSYAELAMVSPNATVVDSKTAREWYLRRTGKEPYYIPYGVCGQAQDIDENALHRYGLERQQYLLFVGRLVPEKEVHTLIGAFKEVRTDKKLVIVGDNPVDRGYVENLKSMADDRVRFLGFVYGDDMTALRNGALMYVHPSTLEGTSVSILEAIGSGLCIVAGNLPENLDLLGGIGVFFESGNIRTLRDEIQGLLDDPARIADIRSKMRSAAANRMSWDAVTDAYEEVYSRVLGRN